MRTFITSRQGNRFKVINLDSISYVDFISMDNNPATPERCSIYFHNTEKAISLENPADARALLEALQSKNPTI